MKITPLPDRIISGIDLVCRMLPQHITKPDHPNRPNTGLAYAVSSTAAYRFSDGTALTCGPGMLIFLPQGCSYTVEKLCSGVTYCVNFTFLPSVDNGCSFDKPFLLAVKDTEKTEKLYAEMLRRWNGRQEGYLFRVRSLLYALLADITEQLASPYFRTDTLRAFDESVTFLRENFNKELFTSDLAARCGISEVYYRRIFKSKYGMSPQKYLSNLRIGYAKELIRSSVCSLESVGEMAGYSSSAYFCRRFRRITGMTPTEYRKETVENK